MAYSYGVSKRHQRSPGPPIQAPRKQALERTAGLLGGRQRRTIPSHSVSNRAWGT